MHRLHAVGTLLLASALGSSAQNTPIALDIPATFAVRYETARPLQCYVVKRPASERITATITGPGRWDICIGTTMCPTDCFDSGQRTATAEPLQPGDSYFVMLVSKDPGTTGTLSIVAAEPVRAGDDLGGLWKWTCCQGRHNGTFQLTTQASDGTFSGKFGDTPAEGSSPISGRVTGNSIAFTRGITAVGQNQQWRAQLSTSGGKLRMINGTWSGYGYVANQSDFQAERISGSPPAPLQAPSSLVGTWTWSCCRGSVSGTWTISSQDAQGRIRGVFGSGSAEGSSPFEGTYRDGQLVFTRSLTGSLAGRQQVWKAQVTGAGQSMRTVNGQWSGYAATPGYTDFQAAFTGSR